MWSPNPLQEKSALKDLSDIVFRFGLSALTMAKKNETPHLWMINTQPMDQN